MIAYIKWIARCVLLTVAAPVAAVFGLLFMAIGIVAVFIMWPFDNDTDIRNELRSAYHIARVALIQYAHWYRWPR